MKLTRWSPWSEMDRLRRDVDQLFDSYAGDVFGDADEPAGRTWTPRMDIRETAEAFQLAIDLPGMNADDIDIAIDGSTVTVSGERRPEWCQEGTGSGFCRAERVFGRFQRAVTLATPLHAERVAATYVNGVLMINVPKAEAAKPKRVTITEG